MSAICKSIVMGGFQNKFTGSESEIVDSARQCNRNRFHSCKDLAPLAVLLFLFYFATTNNLANNVNLNIKTTFVLS